MSIARALSLSVATGDPVPVRFHHPVRTLGRAEGLPTGQVHTTASDDQGRLWMATPNGLACSDGSRVRTWGQADGLSTHGLRCLAVAPDGSVWVGSDVGVDRRSVDGRIEPLFGGWRWGLASDIAVAPDGATWVASAEGLVCWTAARGWVESTDSRLCGTPVHRIAVDGAGQVWAASRHHGLLVRTPHGWQPVAGDAVGTVGTVLCLVAGDGDSVVVGASEGLVGVDASGEIVRGLHLRGPSVHAAHLSDGDLWVGTETDLRHYVVGPAGWQETAVVAEHVPVNHIARDRAGNIWAATDSVGVVKVEPVTAALVRPMLPTGSVFSIRTMASGAVLLAGDQGCGLYDERSATYTRILQLGSERVWDLLAARDGSLWAATETGLRRLRDGESTLVGSDNAVLAAPGRVLLERRDGLWVGTLNGLATVAADGTATVVTDASGESLRYVYTLVPDGDTVWVGTLGNGLWRVAQGRAERVEGPGLLHTGSTYAVAVRGPGSVAVVQDDRIVLLDGEGPSRLLARSDEALAGWTAAFDAGGRLWVGGSTGLCQYSTRTGDLRRRVTLWLGLDGWEFTTSRSLVIDGAGRLLCGLGSGLAIVEPTGLDDLVAESPTVALSSVVWSNVTPEQRDGTWLVPGGAWTVEAHVYSTWPFHEASRLFRYRLLGFERSWSEPTPAAQIRFSSLPPGSYTLEAQAHSPLAGWGPAASVALIEVQRTGSLGRALGLHRSARALRRLAAENHSLEQRVRARTIELDDARNELDRANRDLERLTLTDQLTGVANRRHFDGSLDRALTRRTRTGTPLSLLLVDVDDFKAFNDHFGHVEGDRCLQQVAGIMAVDLREEIDLLARYGGEEFVVVLPDADAATALAVAERLRERVQKAGLAHPGSSMADVVTVSVGVVTAPDATTSAPELIGAADAALYAAKDRGRNRVEVGEVGAVRR